MPISPSLRRRSAFLAACSIALGAVVALPAMSGVAGAAIFRPDRPASDIAQDALRKPAMMMKFTGVRRGQTVVEILPGAGYFTRVFSNAVGPTGKVYAATSRESDELKALVREPGRQNIVLHVGSLAEIAPAGSANLVWTSRNYHDLKGSKAPADAAATVNRAAFAALKPGGYYVVLDHSAVAGSGFRDVDTLHRADADAVKAEVLQAGFVFDSESKLLANPGDDRSKPVFDPAIQGKTDQFVLRFRKPK
ncbi:MAG: class I SAM-dependent methyltransferase [Sphingopyxis sp.]|nr:class I SAM-dependent methyltransferase [Sphingopyxis sp.]